MTEASADKVQAKYEQQYRDLKQILLAKHFAGMDDLSHQFIAAHIQHGSVGGEWPALTQARE